jgi:aspartate racemase
MSLGLVGGLGVGATIRYYRQLVKAHAAMGSVPQLIIVHADVNHVIRSAAAGDRAGLAEYLAAILQRMANAGAQLAAIPAVLPHICAPELAGISPLPLVNLIAEVSGEIRRRELRRVALFGARSTLETRLFGAVDGLEVIQPEPPEFDFIHETYARIETDPGHAGRYSEPLRNLAHKLCRHDGAEAIVLAGTDLSLVFNEANADFPRVGCARVHLDAIMQALRRGPPGPGLRISA